MSRPAPREWTSRRQGEWDWRLALLGAVVIFLAYARVLRGDFLWDDDAHIYANPTIIGPLGLREIWTSGKANYFPLTMTSFWLQHALWGLAPGPYHAITILFHLAAALVLWRVLARLRVPGAWLGAMLWALHPVQVESVAWICELKNTQSGFFYLLAIYFFVRWLPREGGLRVSRDYLFALGAALAAILSKSSTVMLPVVLGLLGWWQGRRKARDVVWLTPFFAVSLLASAWTVWEQKVNSMASGADWDYGIAARLVLAGEVPWFYLGKLLWPHPLIFIYPRWEVHALSAGRWLPLVLTVVSAGLLWRGRDGPLRPVFLAALCFGASLFPVLGLFDVFFFKYSFVGDHFQYLASMAPLVLLAAGVDTLRARGPARAPAIVTAVLLLAPGALLTCQRTAIYLNREVLWRDTVERNPAAWIARMNLGSEYMSTGRAALAIPHFEAALRLRPGDALAEANWGGALYLAGRSSEALPHLENAIRLKPDLAEAHHTLGVALLSLDRPREAIPRFEAAARLKPDFLQGRLDLGNAYFRAQRWADAIAQYETVVRAAPAFPAARNNLGTALLQLGRVAEAIPQYRAALEIEPGLLDARMNLAAALAAAGRKSEAAATYEEVLRRQPDHPAAREQLRRLRAP